MLKERWGGSREEKEGGGWSEAGACDPSRWGEWGGRSVEAKRPGERPHTAESGGSSAALGRK